MKKILIFLLALVILALPIIAAEVPHSPPAIRWTLAPTPAVIAVAPATLPARAITDGALMASLSRWPAATPEAETMLWAALEHYQHNMRHETSYVLRC